VKRFRCEIDLPVFKCERMAVSRLYVAFLHTLMVPLLSRYFARKRSANVEQG